MPHVLTTNVPAKWHRMDLGVCREGIASILDLGDWDYPVVELDVGREGC
jgi:hypothetical protein